MNISDPGQSRDRKFRKVVRVNAMIKHRRNQKQHHIEALKRARQNKGIIENSLSTKENLQSDVDVLEEFFRNHARRRLCPKLADRTINNNENKPSCRGVTSSPQTLLGAGMVDPFGTYPGHPQSQCHRLLNHFLYVLAPDMLPTATGQENCPFRTIFVRQALTDQCLFNAVLFLAAYHIDSLCERTVSQATLSYRGETIRLINAKLRSLEQAISDSTIGAVALLSLGCTKLKGTLLGQLNGNQPIAADCTESDLHLNALQWMVKMRGGLEALGMNGVLHMLINWQDLSSSTVEASTPRFERYDFGRTRQEAISLVDRYVPGEVAEEFINAVSDSGFPGELQELLPFLRNLTRVRDSITRIHNATTTEIMAFGSVRSSLEHQLLLHPKHGGDYGARTSQDGYLEESCRVAALIYIEAALRGFRPKFTVPKFLKHKLMEGYERRRQIDPNVVGETSSGVLLWILCTGAILSLNDMEKAWFAGNIIRAMTRARLESWQVVEECLTSLLWTKSMSATLYRLVWPVVEKEVGNLRIFY
ncbi:MAG: hypothetical protein Q9187_004783 [Circinaria calcarea]